VRSHVRGVPCLEAVEWSLVTHVHEDQPPTVACRPSIPISYTPDQDIFARHHSHSISCSYSPSLSLSTFYSHTYPTSTPPSCSLSLPSSSHLPLAPRR
jgi:hypothetical protein